MSTPVEWAAYILTAVSVSTIVAALVHTWGPEIPTKISIAAAARTSRRGIPRTGAPCAAQLIRPSEKVNAMHRFRALVDRVGSTRWTIGTGLIAFAIAYWSGSIRIQVGAAIAFVVLGVLHSLEVYCTRRTARLNGAEQ